MDEVNITVEIIRQQRHKTINVIKPFYTFSLQNKIGKLYEKY